MPTLRPSRPRHAGARSGSWNPLSAFGEAIQTTVGWTAAVFAAATVGLWIGLSIGTGGLVGPRDTLLALCFASIAWLAAPGLFVAFAVTVLALYLPARFESVRLRIVAGAATLVTWAMMAPGLSWVVQHGY